MSIPTTSDLTAAFSNLTLHLQSPKPTPDQCIAHLKLLEAFHQLREDVATTDGLFGINDSLVPAHGLSEPQRIDALRKIREKRWAVYVARAAARFERWWERSVEPGAVMIRQNMLDVGNSLGVEGTGEKSLSFSKDHLPPLDVIMVWHSFMLNPRCFLEDCLRYGKMRFWKSGFPWEAINSCIDNNTLDFTGTTQAHDGFTKETGLAWDNLQDSNAIPISCPNCSQKLKSPWTSAGESSSWLFNDGSLGSGFADKDFQLACSSCRIVINHEVLRVGKFRGDVELLLRNDTPMPGTILSRDGTPRPDPPNGPRQVSFPCRLITHGLSADLLERTRVDAIPPPSVSSIRATFEAGLKSARLVGKAKGKRLSTMERVEKISIRRMMSRYWNNSSMFALDLVGAVIRQGSFIEKMHALDWLHSPTVASTMARLITKYARYFEILSRYPTQVAVPTLDVDLAWHTHQLSPESYYQYSVVQTNVFIDHDDKIDEVKLSTAFEWTSKTYEKMFSSVYSECTCWYCESIRESTTSIWDHFHSHRKSVDHELEQLRARPTNERDREGPHVSAHNSIQGEGLRSRLRKHQQARLESHYKKVCTRYRKMGMQPPEWQHSDHDDRRVLMNIPYYAPHSAGAYRTREIYVADPSCANFAIGAVGNCCKGACGGGVAAGSCGNMSGGCGNEAAGGCGGGGGGGGGCGGGGGGD